MSYAPHENMKFIQYITNIKLLAQRRQTIQYIFGFREKNWGKHIEILDIFKMMQLGLINSPTLFETISSSKMGNHIFTNFFQPPAMFFFRYPPQHA